MAFAEDVFDGSNIKVIGHKVTHPTLAKMFRVFDTGSKIKNYESL